MSRPMDNLLSALRGAGWLGRESSDSLMMRAIEPGCDLLPLLIEEAMRFANSGGSAGQKPSVKRVQNLLDWLSQRGSKLTVDWPGVIDRTRRTWIGCRLLWCPNGIPSGRKVAWVSSRLGRAIDERPDWFGVLRTAAAKLDPNRDLLLTASATTTDRFLERAAILFGLRLLRIEIDERRSLADWLLRLRRRLWRESLTRSDRETSDDVEETELSPEPLPERLLVEMSPPIDADVIDSAINDRPLADRVLLSLADQIVALQVRENGNLHELLRRRLIDTHHQPGSVWLAWGDQLVSPDIVNELQPLGAVSWHLRPSDSMPNVDSHRPDAPARLSRPSEILPSWPWADGDYLLHWTRRRSGPWPDQSASAFVDELLLAQAANDSSAFAALVRIARQKRLIASATSVREGHRVVSFSAISIQEFATSRTFRRHRTRFDYEPFGIGLRREWLISRGARPVCYGDDSIWQKLTDDERPYFQLRQTRGRRGAAIIDWSLEAEWRVIGDLDLAAAGPRDIVLFVPSDSDARSLAAVSPCPIVVIPSGIGMTT